MLLIAAVESGKMFRRLQHFSAPEAALEDEFRDVSGGRRR